MPPVFSELSTTGINIQGSTCPHTYSSDNHLVLCTPTQHDNGVEEDDLLRPNHEASLAFGQAPPKGDENDAHILAPPGEQVIPFPFLTPASSSSSSSSSYSSPTPSSSSTTLLEYVRGHLFHRLPPWKAVRIFRQMVKLVKDAAVPHGVICLDNFVIEPALNRVSILVDPDKHAHLVTATRPRVLTSDFLRHHPPQYHNPESFTTGDEKSAVLNPYAADVYALGCCLFAMLCGRWLFNDEEQRRRVHLGGIDAFLSDYFAQGLCIPGQSALSLIRAMTHPDPAVRVSLEGVANHLWCTSFGRET